MGRRKSKSFSSATIVCCFAVFAVCTRLTPRRPLLFSRVPFGVVPDAASWRNNRAGQH
jgi:hypothetical protein